MGYIAWRSWSYLALLALLGCTARARSTPAEPFDAGGPSERVRSSLAPPELLPARAMSDRVLTNRYAYIPPQCYTKTRDERGRAANPCYVCHTPSRAPNYTDDGDLQQVLKLPAGASANPWSNLFSPAVERAPQVSDEALLAYVRKSNYFDDRHEIALHNGLEPLRADWDGEGDGSWQGFLPDAYFRFDEQGYDLRPDGSRTGWRAFAYAPLPGTFFPTNGSAGDVLIRLDNALRETVDGTPDDTITTVNLAIVEALITHRDVVLEPTDEARLGVDLDLDGKLATARVVRADAQRGEQVRLHYAGRAGRLERSGVFPIASGLFPLGTEFLHTLRYLDLSPQGEVTMSARMKELRYAKKVRWFSYADLRAHAAAELVEENESADGVQYFVWQHDRGIYNGQGWLLQGFIESVDGTLRPQTYEETVFCAGCHGGVGATTDSMFSLPRKLAAPDRGWFHWEQRGFRGLPEPERSDGALEYTLYLQHNRAGDEFRDNDEVLSRFFTPGGALRPAALRQLHHDIATLLVPSPARALALNRAYRAVVLEQSFAHGRDAVLSASPRVHRRAPTDTPTGIQTIVRGETLLAHH
jgi:hypothetical protein